MTSTYPPPPTPIDLLNDARQKERQGKKDLTQKLWHDWHNNGRQPEHMAPLIDMFQPLIQQKVREWKPPSVPISAFRANVTKEVVNAIHSYDPNRGASLNTHVNYRIPKAKRYMAKTQNLAYMSEDDAFRVGDYNRAIEHLTDDLGRTPTHHEIAGLMGVKPAYVQRLAKSIRRDIPASAFEEDPGVMASPRAREILPLIRQDLAPEEQAVFDLVHGAGITNGGEIARRLKVSPSTVSRINKAIEKKFKKYL